jgi:hypothetical protein
MAFARYRGVAQDAAGNVIPNATVEVRRDAPGRPVVPLFSDRNGKVRQGNPITTNARGQFFFHAPGGVYYIRVFTGPSQAPFQEFTDRYVALGTAAERDVEDLARVLESGTAGFSTIEELQAFVPSTAEGVLGKVLRGAGAGFYHYDDTQEEGEKWIKDRPLFDTFARLTVVDGTANSIEAELEDGIDDASVKLMALIPEETNTGPVTLNGLPLKDVSGAAIIAGQLVAGRSYNLTDEGDHYRLRQESDVTGVPAGIAAAAAEAVGQISPLVVQAEAARDIAVPAKDAAVAAKDLSVAAKAAAELARDAALAGGTVYPDVATGRAASSATTGPDSYFKVLGSGAISFRLYQRLTSSTQSLVMEQPSADALEIVDGRLSGAAVFTGFSTSSATAMGEFATTLTGAGSPYAYWPVNVPSGEKVTLFYKLRRTGANPTAWLANGANSNLSGGTNALVCDDTLRSLVMTSSGAVTRLIVQQIATGASTLAGNIVILGGDNAATGVQTNGNLTALLALSRLLQAESAGVQASTSKLGQATGAAAVPFNIATFTQTGFGEFEALVNASTNASIYWPIDQVPVGDSVTLWYRLHKTGGNVTAWLGTGASANVSGGTQTLTCDGTLRSVTLTSTGAAVRLILQQVQGSGSSGSFGGNIAFLAGDPAATTGSRGGLSLQLLSIMTLLKKAEAALSDTLGPLASTVSSLGTSVSALNSSVASLAAGGRSRTPVTCRNGLSVTTYSGAQSVTRRMKNGVVAVHKLSLRFANFYVTPSGIVDGANEIRVAAAIEYPIGSAPRPFYGFDSSATISVPPGGIVEAIEPTGVLLPPGVDFLLHEFAAPYVDGSPGGTLPVGRTAVNGGTYGDKYKAGTGAANVTQVIGGETTSPASPANLFSHVALVGEAVYGAPGISAIVWGDSIPFGFNEHLTMTHGNGNVGPIERWLALHGVGMINLSVASSAAKQWKDMATGSRAKIAAVISGLGTHAILALGRNDLPTDTAAELLASIETISDWCASTLKLAPVGVTVTPKSASTNDWEDAEGQTTDAGTNSKRITYNGWLRDDEERPASMVSALELADQYETARNSGIWLDEGTDDGVHPLGALNSSAAAALPAAASVLI